MNRIETLVARRNELAAGITYVRAALDDEGIAQDGFDEGVAYCRDSADQITALDSQIDDLERIAALALDERNVTPANITYQDRTVDPFDTRDLGPWATTADIRSRAMSAVESMRHLDDGHRQAATLTLERVADPRGDVARRILLTGSDAYRSAFQKMASGNPMAVHTLTAEEGEAMNRAASLTDSAGGYAIPFTLDPTIILTSNGSTNAIRSLARVVQITTDTWNGISTAGVTASYDAEAAEVSDDTPTLAQPSITTRMARAFVPFSIEIGMDWPGMEAEIRRLIMDAKDNLETTVFWSGASGSNQPIGIETALTGGSSVVTAAGEALVLADVQALYQALPPRYRNGNTAAVAEWSTLGKVRALLSAAGDRSSFNEATGALPGSLYGFPVLEHSSVDPYSAVDAAATATSHLAVIGDWSNYVIADRVGMSMELVPHLFATANNLPSGQRGFFAYWRNGADSVNDAAFRMLKLVTAA